MALQGETRVILIQLLLQVNEGLQHLHHQPQLRTLTGFFNNDATLTAVLLDRLLHHQDPRDTLSTVNRVNQMWHYPV